MKLSETQINAIDKNLEKLGVVYIDYKSEILDHIATEIEEIMIKKASNFDDALTVIMEKWSPNFKKSSSLLFGMIWVLPEILLRKAKKIYWKKMWKLLISITIFTPVLLFFKEYFLGEANTIYNFFIVILLIQLVGFFAIVSSNQKTTSGFLFKQQFLGLLGLYLVELHFLSSNPQIFERPISTFFPVFFMISILALAPIANFYFLKEHFSQLHKNRNLYLK